MSVLRNIVRHPLIAPIMVAGTIFAVHPITNAHAASYSYRLVGRQIVVDMNGDIELNEAAILTEWMNRVGNPTEQRFGAKITAVVLNSGGGNLRGGADVAYWVRSNSLRTGVSAGGTCASACSLIWTAGVARSVAPDARIGIHAATRVNSRYSDGQASMQGTAIAVQLYSQYGMPRDLLVQIMTTPPGDMYWLSNADYYAMGAKVTW